jgi:succinate dehydrogenase / fumarate reductase, flavoprotein subunit
MRTESRGAHYRSDFPETTKEWEKNIVCAKDETGEMRLWTEPVPPIPTEIRETLAEHHALDYHQLE